MEGTLVAAGTLGLLRLCQRLLPCKPEAAELLLRGLQLVPSLDPEVSRPEAGAGQGQQRQGQGTTGWERCLQARAAHQGTVVPSLASSAQG